MTAEDHLSPAELREWLRYEPDTGRFFWLKKPSPRVNVGDEAGHRAGEVYPRWKFRGRRYVLHRMAYCLMNCEWPPKGMDIDHENRDKHDTRWDNLRLATRKQNKENVIDPNSSSTTGYRGVHFRPKRRIGRQFVAVINTDEKQWKLIGAFATAEEAHEAYKKAKREHHKFWSEQ